MHPFDFWHKMYDLLMWIVSGYFVNSTFLENIGYYVIASLSRICVYGLLFVLDATSIVTKYKNVFIIAMVSYSMYIGLYVYFVVDDTISN